MTNGIGTWFCTAGFDPGWGWDDAIECPMFVFFPVGADRAVHLKQEPGGSFQPDQYYAIPLKMSERLVQHVMIRRWSSGLIGLGVFLLFMVAVVVLLPPKGKVAEEWAVTKPIFGVLSPCLIAAGVLGRWSLRKTERREREIRSLLGLHALGTSDPTSWVDEDLRRIKPSSELFCVPTDAQAVRRLLDDRAWSAAMWAARLGAARGDAAEGERLTDEVLSHPGAREALARFDNDQRTWAVAMNVASHPAYAAVFVTPSVQ
jgi:hypothetical protein